MSQGQPRGNDQQACSVCVGIMLGSFEENPDSPTGMSIRWDCPDHPGVAGVAIRKCEHCSGRGYTTKASVSVSGSTGEETT